RQYLVRWAIERLFYAWKSGGFNLEDTHFTQPHRVERLVVLVALASAWAIRVGAFKQRTTPRRQKKTLQRAALSLFRYGLDHLQALLAGGRFHLQALIHLMTLWLKAPPKKITYLETKLV
ncbi:MAG: hypothetical protein ACFCBW_02795, partial [Candidatus Competibacterales bacterium]